ncbi:MAG TPA: hypothetical protein VFQ85_16870 [Mycobacteriales bacterium]|jgi:hypothetical protein|nr:hypothetical protein [Mycobacteriales bacterium]
MSVTITSTETHPHCAEILGVLAQIVHLDDEGLRRLALAWQDTADVSRARDKALQPDTPLILEVLSAFDSLAGLFADDLAGTAAYITLPAPTTALALKAVRDAIAAAYARPVLTAQEYTDLSGPWHSVYPDRRMQMPDFGPQHHEVLALLTSIPGLSCHRHDEEADAVYSGLLLHARGLDADAHGRAVESAWQAAVMTGRRRLWFLASRSAHESFNRACPSCARLTDDDDRAVLAVCLGVVAGMLVRDVLDTDSADTLLAPVGSLMPPTAA